MKQEATIPDWMLERYTLGELPPAALSRLETALSGPAADALHKRLAAIEAGNRTFLDRYPDLESLPSRKKQPLLGRLTDTLALHWKTLAPAVAVFLAVLLATIPGTDRQITTLTDGNRIKGSGDTLVVFRQASRSNAEQLSNGSTIRPNDRLQLGFRAEKARHAVILSIDGRGAVTLHYPDSPGDSTAVQMGRLQLLEKSYILDDAPAFERFFLILSDTRVDTASIIRKARQLAGRARNMAKIPGVCARQLSILFRKAPL